MKGLLAAFLLLAGVANADVPKAVLDTVHRKYAGAKVAGVDVENEGGKTVYEVKVVAGERKVEVVCSADGRVLAEEETITLEAAPDKVRQALKDHAKYGSWTVQHVERVVENEKADSPLYEIKVGKGSAHAELVFTPDGRLSRTEEEK